jgi:CMP-N-acetylneuraminic acid synthetase
MKAIAVIPARGGSKGIPRKNLMQVGGKPLIAWTIEAARDCPFVEYTVVSSDDDEILGVAHSLGAETLKRPAELATDTANVKPVLKHALVESEKKHGSLPKYVTFLQPTSPLRTAAHLTRAFELLRSDPDADALMSVYEIDKSLLKSSVVNTRGYLEYVSKKEFANMNRQMLPNVYMPNGAIYIMYAQSCVVRPRFDGARTLPFIMSAEESLDLDTMDDIPLIEAALARVS